MKMQRGKGILFILLTLTFGTNRTIELSAPGAGRILPPSKSLGKPTETELTLEL